MDSQSVEDLKKHIISMENLGHQDQDDRITMRLDFYYQTFGEDPVGLPIRSNATLKTKGLEPYIRKVKVSEPKKLFLGDFDQADVGYIVIVNIEGIKLQRNPTPSEREAISQKIVMLDGFEIDPFGMPFIAKVSLDSPLEICCPSGTAQVQVAVFPR